MRLTVGPLPSAVYWRRRAAVLGVALLFLLVVVYSCSGSKKSAANSEGTGSPKPTVTVHTPTSDPPSEKASDGESPNDASTGGADAPPPDPGPAADAGTCTDEEMLVTPVPSRNPVQRGVTIELRLKIKNISNRTCERDVGADAQEIYVTLGAQKIWSSDTCGTAQGSRVESFPPALEHEYTVAWNGNSSTSCAKGVATGDAPDAGKYQLVGRLGTKHSEPVKLTITD